MPCGCTKITPFIVPDTMSVEPAFHFPERDVHVGIQNIHLPSNTLGWVWDHEAQALSSRDTNTIRTDYVYRVPFRYNKFNGSKGTKRRRGLRLTDRKGSWKRNKQ